MSRLVSVVCSITVAASAARAEEVPTFAEVMHQDGPYIDIPAGVEVPTGPPSVEDLLALADLDGDPNVITDQEAEMLTLLIQVMIGTPLVE